MQVHEEPGVPRRRETSDFNQTTSTFILYVRHLCKLLSKIGFGKKGRERGRKEGGRKRHSELYPNFTGLKMRRLRSREVDRPSLE